MIEQQQTPVPTQSRNSLTVEKPTIDNPPQAAITPATVTDQSPIVPAGKPFPRLQLKIAIPYLATLLISFYLATSNAGTNFKVAMAWLIVGIVSSQVVVDLAEFSSPRAKARFSATYRILAGLAALGIAYFG
jgi:hypothetical protein